MANDSHAILMATATHELEEVLGNDKVNSFPGPEPQPLTTRKRIFCCPDRSHKDIQEIGLVSGVTELAACIHRYTQVHKLTTLSGSLNDLSRLPAK